jgi:Ca2+-binding RTX toxin-like protein
VKVAFGRVAQAIPALVLLLCLIAAPTAASAATPKCPAGFTAAPERATIVGTPGDDTLRGMPGRDVIAGLGGDDRILGLRRDHACGGRGNDVLKGKGAMMGGPGNDVVRSTRAGDLGEWGGRGNDRMYAFKGGANDFVPGPGNDLVVGATDASPNFLHFEDAKRPVTVSLAAGTAGGQGSDTLRHIQNVVGGRFDDTLIGDDGFNDLDGAGGDDAINGLGGDDRLVGGEGEDTIDGGTGNDGCSGEQVSNCEATADRSHTSACATGSARRRRLRRARRASAARSSTGRRAPG